MVIDINEVIGASICMDVEDILVVSGKAATFYQGNKTLIEVDHTLRVQGYHTMEEVETCAAEIAYHLSNLLNWEQPIFPEEPQCSKLEVVPNYFNASGTFWSCVNQMSEATAVSSVNTLSYESKMSEKFVTKDGSSLDIDCMRAYTDAASEKASFMFGEIKNELSRSGCSASVSSATQLHSFTVMENQVTSQNSSPWPF